jgi:hypothetical protein
MTVFLRRELLVWPNADVEVPCACRCPRVSTLTSIDGQFLVTFVISLMKSIDIRSEGAVRLLAGFLDMDAPYVPGERHVIAEHFAHGPSTLAHSWLRFGLIIHYPSRNILLSTFAIQRSQRIRLSCAGTLGS